MRVGVCVESTKNMVWYETFASKNGDDDVRLEAHKAVEDHETLQAPVIVKYTELPYTIEKILGTRMGQSETFVTVVPEGVEWIY